MDVWVSGYTHDPADLASGEFHVEHSRKGAFMWLISAIDQQELQDELYWVLSEGASRELGFSGSYDELSAWVVRCEANL